MQSSQQREKISPSWASKKGRHPVWNTIDNSKRHWSKVFFIEGQRAGKRVQKKRKKYNRERMQDCLTDIYDSGQPDDSGDSGDQANEIKPRIGEDNG